MSYSSDVCICMFLYHEVKSCDDIYNNCILAQLVDLIHPVSPIFLILVFADGLFQLLRVVLLFEVSSDRCSCWLFLTWINRNPLDCLFAQSLQLAPSSNGNYNNNHILTRIFSSISTEYAIFIPKMKRISNVLVW